MYELKKNLFYTMLLTRILTEVSTETLSLLWGIVSFLCALFLCLCFYFEYKEPKVG